MYPKIRSTTLALSIAAAIAIAPGAAAVATPSKLNGKYLFNLYRALPNKFSGTSLCLLLIENGSVQGVAESGTWTAHGFPHGGQFIHVGDSIMFTYFDGNIYFYMKTPVSFSGAISFGSLVYGDISSGGLQYDAFLKVVPHGC
jgi:hypothetical protein